MMRSSAYNRFGVLMGTSSRASGPRWLSLRGNSLPLITLISSQGDFCATALAVLQEYARKETMRIRLTYLHGHSGIARASNTAADLASGEVVALLDHDDLLTPDALLEVARRLEEVPDTDLLYVERVAKWRCT